MATQFDPIAKDESLNTTESPSRNIADVLAEELSAIEQAIAGNTDSGWLTTTAVNGNKMAYRKVGKVVYVARNTTGTIPANTATLVGTLPAGYRPLYYAFYGSPSAYVQIAPDGSINVNTPTANYMHPWYVSFIADA